MKIPLTFQITEYDCGTSTLLNALLFLFEREEIPVELLKAIYRYTLDTEGVHGIIGEAGTSRRAVDKLSNWILNYTKTNDFQIKCKVLEGKEVTLAKMKECLNNNGCIMARCYQETEHYVLITKMDEIFTYIFDPYYVEEDYYCNDSEVAVVLNQMFTHNRLVKNKRLFSQEQKDFSLMEIDKREVLLINKV